MKHRRMHLMIAAAVLGCILGTLATVFDVSKLLLALTALGQRLRSLSESGACGDIAAWGIVLLLSALPLIGLLRREDAKTGRLLFLSGVEFALLTIAMVIDRLYQASAKGERFFGTLGILLLWILLLGLAVILVKEWGGYSKTDCLLLLCSAELFAMLYFLVNPTLLSSDLLWMDSETIGSLWAMISSGTVLATLLAWVFLRLLRKAEECPASVLPKLLAWGALVLAFLLGVGAAQELVAEIRELAAKNTGVIRVWKSGALLTGLAIIRILPDLIAAGVLLWGSDLARALEAAPFAERTVLLAEQIAQRCKRAAKLSIWLAVGSNLLQLLCFAGVAAVRIRVELPLLTLALCAILFLLCNYFRKAKAVSDDNATII